jgi:hypothetical protein
VYHLVVFGGDGTNARTHRDGGAERRRWARDELAGRVARRSSGGDRRQRHPGDVLIVPLDGATSIVRLPAAMRNSVSWQPFVNPDDPAASAPEGLPTP